MFQYSHLIRRYFMPIQTYHLGACQQVHPAVCRGYTGAAWFCRPPMGMGEEAAICIVVHLL